MKRLNWGLLFVFSILLLMSCDRIKHPKVKDKEDSFNTNTGGFDRPRIPLVKPYELLKVSGSEWRMELETPQLLTLSIHNVKGVNVILDKIVIYSEGGTDFMNKRHDKAWFIIDHQKNKESGFDSFSDFTRTIKISMPVDSLFKEPNKVFESFTSDGSLKW